MFKLFDLFRFLTNLFSAQTRHISSAVRAGNAEDAYPQIFFGQN